MGWVSAVRMDFQSSLGWWWKLLLCQMESACGEGQT